MVMAHVASVVAVLVCGIGVASPGLSSPVDSLQPLASRCFEAPRVTTCSSFFDLSDRLKEQAEHRSQLRCYTSLLTLEAVVSKALRGIVDPARQHQAFEDATRDCP